MIRRVIEMGYSQAIIKIALERRLALIGDDYPNVQSLLEDIFALEAEQSSVDSGIAQGNATLPARFIFSSTNNAHQTGIAKSLPAAALQARGVLAPNHSTTHLVSVSDSGISSSASSDATDTASRSSHVNASSDVSGPSTDAASQVVFLDNIDGMPAAPRDGPTAEMAAAEKKKVKKKKGKKPKKTEASLLANDNKEDVPLSEDAETKVLLEENSQLREARTCKICLDKEVNTVFLPCGHLVCCNECAPEMDKCPVCRQLIRGTVRIFLS